MNFTEEINDYLKGNKFSNGIKIIVAYPEKKIITRIDYIEHIVKNKNVIHVGFADHIELINQKINKNEWLHKRLLTSAFKCLGIDINNDSISFIKANYGISDIYCHDIINDNPLQEITEQKWDYIILGEILEHTDNPVLFLKSIRQKYGKCVDNILITVPNAFELTNIEYIFRNMEFINSDHRYWFTPYTLAKVGIMSGLNIIDFICCQSYFPSNFFKKFLIKRFPILRESIVMIFGMN